jgi:prefoldin subunit 5
LRTEAWFLYVRSEVMAVLEIKIADKQTLDAVHVKTDVIQASVGEVKSGMDSLRSGVDGIQTTADAIDSTVGKSGDKENSAGKTLFSLLKYAVSMFVSHFTSSRAAKLDNLDEKVSTRAAQSAVDTLQTDITAVKVTVEELGQRGGGGGITPATKTVALHYAPGQASADGLLFALNRAGRLREYDIRGSDGAPIDCFIVADRFLVDGRSEVDISFTRSLSVVLKEPKKSKGTVYFFAVYDMGV